MGGDEGLGLSGDQNLLITAISSDTHDWMPLVAVVVVSGDYKRNVMVNP